MDNGHKKTQSSHAVSLVRCIRGNSSWLGEDGLERSLNPWARGMLVSSSLEATSTITNSTLVYLVDHVIFFHLHAASVRSPRGTRSCHSLLQK